MLRKHAPSVSTAPWKHLFSLAKKVKSAGGRMIFTEERVEECMEIAIKMSLVLKDNSSKGREK
jgi:hypothetical protein